MEVRGECRGFMESIRTFFNTIRKRIGQRRTRQRTNNYRICRNLAMAKTESKKERRLKKAKVTKENNSANAAAEVNSAKRKIQEEDGAPRGLRERMMSALQAFQEGRKPQWVRQRGWRRHEDGLNIEDTQAGQNLHEPQAREDIQTEARENLHESSPEIQARVDIHTQTGEIQASRDTHTGEDIQPLARDKNQAGEDIQTAANFQTQISPDIQAREDIQSQARKADQTGSGELHEIREEDIQKAGGLQTQVEKDIPTQAGEVLPDTQARKIIKTETGENIQTQAEPASWVVAYGQMWQKMAQHNGHDLYRQDLHATQATEEPASWVVANSQMWQRMAQRHDLDLYVEGAYDTQARESLDDILTREGLQADEPACWFVANGQIWGNSNTHKEDNSFIHSMPIMNYWLSSMNLENWAEQGVQVTSPFKYMGMF